MVGWSGDAIVSFWWNVASTCTYCSWQCSKHRCEMSMVVSALRSCSLALALLVLSFLVSLLFHDV